MYNDDDMTQLITGLHHVTALTSDAQKNIDFYVGILGLRLVKKTINFDAPDVYHFYYGDEKGTPGTILTFFPYSGLVQGRKGKGQLTVTSFSVPVHSFDFWMERFNKYDVPYQQPQERFGTEAFIYFEDFDRLGLELVGSSDDDRPGFTRGHIPYEYGIRGFHGVTLSEEGYERTAGLLTEHMDHKLIAEKGNRFRFAANGRPGSLVDIVCNPDSLRGYGGAGTVHHVAFATADDASQRKFREKAIQAGIDPTPVLDRQYFHSIYFREPGGILFEVATSDIGFALDEETAYLGEGLKLPPWEEGNREEIEGGLEEVVINIEKFK